MESKVSEKTKLLEKFLAGGGTPIDLIQNETKFLPP